MDGDGRRTLSFCRQLTVLLALLPMTASSAQEVRPGRTEIVRRAIEFHGGGTYAESLSDLRVCSKSGCFAVRARIDGGNFEVEATGKVRQHVRRILIDNDNVSWWQDGARMVVPPERVQSLRNWVMARAYFVFLPFRLEDESVIQEDLGLETWDGQLLHKVKVTFEEGSSSGADDEFLYWFDPETGRLEQFAYSFAGDPGGLRFRKAHNYRRVGGILFYDQENWGVEGDGLTVDQVLPGIPDTWDLVSEVTVEDIQVETLKP